MAAASAQAVPSVSSVVEERVLQVDRGVGAHGQAVAQRGLHAVGAEGDQDDLAALLLLDAQGLLDGELVVGRDDPVERRSRRCPCRPAPIRMRASVSGTCFTQTTIFIDGSRPRYPSA